MEYVTLYNYHDWGSGYANICKHLKRKGILRYADRNSESLENTAFPGKRRQKKELEIDGKNLIHLPRQIDAKVAEVQYLQGFSAPWRKNFPHFSHSIESLVIAPKLSRLQVQAGIFLLEKFKMQSEYAINKLKRNENKLDKRTCMFYNV